MDFSFKFHPPAPFCLLPCIDFELDLAYFLDFLCWSAILTQSLTCIWLLFLLHHILLTGLGLFLTMNVALHMGLRTADVRSDLALPYLAHCQYLEKQVIEWRIIKLCWVVSSWELAQIPTPLECLQEECGPSGSVEQCYWMTLITRGVQSEFY